MGPAAAISTGLRKYADFRGRAGRAEFWWFIGFALLLLSAAGAVNAVLGLGSPVPVGAFAVDTLTVTATQYVRPGWLQLVVALALAPALISIQVRRLHDRGLKGWWWWLTLLDVACFLGTLILVFAVYIQPSAPPAPTSLPSDSGWGND